ncbi:membrane protein [Pandoraea cepalis]|uniref:Membrane protein n=1 Tax=Pandoraea cepalis TaxID=2508294 RepID=A0A5E4RDY5_9BURK|nr:DotA/TraY family protein [Pandoraea cepalis]VVD61500.1 membrane protein [Pandoraea cepalis]
MRRLFKTLAGPLALFALLFSAPAHADIFTPPSTDWIMVHVMPLLGAGSDASASPFSPLFSILNTAVMTIGGLIAAYVMFASIASTAHDGEMMGKQWSSMWVPIRSTLGMAMILPVKGGFCLIQLIVLWLATQGIGLADTVWTAYLTNWTQQTATYTSPVLDVKARALFESLVLSNVCYESVRGTYASESADDQATVNQLNNGQDISSSVGATWFSDLDANGAGTVGYNFGRTGDGSTYAACGTVTATLKGTTASTSNTNGAGLQTATAWLNAAPATSAIESGHVDALKSMQSAADNLAKQMVGTAGNGALAPATVNAAIDAAVKAYETTVSAKANAAFAAAMGNGQLASSLGADGFVVSGAEYAALGRMKSDVNASVSNVPTAVDGMTAGKVGLMGLFDNQTDSDVKHAQSLLDAANTQAAAKTGGGGGDDKFSKVINLFAGQGFTAVTDPNEDPMMRAYDVGQGLFTTVQNAGIAAATLMGFAAVPLAGNVVMAAASLFGGLFTFIASCLLVPAFVLCFVLPMMPFFAVALAAFGWLVMLFESLVAAPLWAVTFLSPNHGQDGIGSQKQGLMMILSLTLRPALLTIGVCGSYVLMQPIGLFANSLFGVAWGATGGGGGLFELMRMVAGAVLFMMFLFQSVRFCLKLITSVPDNVLDWIGGGHGAVLGGHVEEMGRGANAASAAGAGAAGAALGSAAAGAAKGADALRSKLAGMQKGREREVGNLSERGGTTIPVPKGGTTPPTGGRGDLPAEPSTLKDAKASAAAGGGAGKPAAPTAQASSAGSSKPEAPATASPERAASGSSQDGATASRADLAKNLAANMERAAAIRDRLVEPTERATEAEKLQDGAAPDAEKGGKEDSGTV